MINKIVLFSVVILGYIIFYDIKSFPHIQQVSPLPVVDFVDRKTWSVQSIDTMKFSRDRARDLMLSGDASGIIDLQVSHIADAGASHVAVSAPYDEEFWPFIKLWVDSARQHNLKVFFRGSLSGWENWFGYPDITPVEHIAGVDRFISSNPDLFEDGDIFCGCIECENGGPGDPRYNGQLDGFRKFIIEEYAVAQKAFMAIGKDVQANYFSTNGGVAELVHDAETTSALGNLIVIDHYVKTPEGLINDINKLSGRNGAKVALGELGAPVPDIHGAFTEDEQAEWLDEALGLLAQNSNVVAINYWTSFDGSTALWREDGQPRKAVDVLKKYYNPKYLYGFVIDEIGRPLPAVEIRFSGQSVRADERGYYEIPKAMIRGGKISASAAGFADQDFSVINEENQRYDLVLEKIDKSLLEKSLVIIKKISKKY